MPLVPIAFPKQSNPARYKASGNARLINCYIESLGEEGKSPLSLVGIDGLKVFCDVGANQPFRGAIALDYAVYCVIGYELYKVTPSGSFTALGTIAGIGHVYMSRNRHSPVQITIVSEDGQNYVLEGDELVRNPDKDLISPNSVTFFNGYNTYSHLDGRLTATAIDNAKEVNALDFDTAEYHPDKLLRNIARGSELIAFGEQTTEVWQPASGEGFPFLRTTVIQKGCLSGASVQIIDGAALWVADDKTVRFARGYEPQKISNGAVDRAIDEVSDPENITSMAWDDKGHNFYAVNHETFTWIYDLATGLWHERKSHVRDNWRCKVTFTFQGKKMFGDAVSGVIYELSDAHTEGNEPVEMKCIIPIHATPNRITLNAIYIDAVTGLSPQNEEGFINLRTSKDNGYSWSNSRKLSLGKAGEYKKRLPANRFGTSKEDGFLIELTSNSLKAINGIYADIEKLGT